MGTNETAMAWIQDEINRSTGLPKELGGIPLDEIGATGFGLVVAAEAAEKYSKLPLEGARIAVQGFGSVGKHAARFFAGKGALLVAAADSTGTVYDPDGLDIEQLINYKNEGGRIRDFSAGEKGEREAVTTIACDILIPAARPDAIRADNADGVQAKLIVQGANIGVTEKAEAVLHARGVLCLPDFISNAGGVICAATEYRGGTQTQALQAIEEKIRTNTVKVLNRSRQQGILPRQAAVAMADKRIRKAMKFRRWG
jgi:glutamate dehydrogenase/leucine dehydrogenase